MKKGELLRHIRTSMGSNQSDFGMTSGIDQSNLAKYESGTRHISYDRLIESLGHLGIEVNVVCTYKGKQIHIID